MRTLEKQMSTVKSCSVIECSYNHNEMCHTKAITVGDSQCPFCDTEARFATKGGFPYDVAGVGACKESDCVFNDALECMAGGIDVKIHEDHAECATYKKK